VPGATGFVRFFRVTGPPVDGNLIEGDFCVTDVDNNSVCTVTDTGRIYIIDSTDGELGKATLMSAINPRFPSEYKLLMDFNPIVTALRLIGGDCSNYAAVNRGWDTTAVQAGLSYGAGHVNFRYTGGAGDSTAIVGGRTSTDWTLNGQALSRTKRLQRNWPPESDRYDSIGQLNMPRKLSN
jgi:hypothetical protein